MLMGILFGVVFVVLVIGVAVVLTYVSERIITK